MIFNCVKKLKNAELGKDIYILANGPSIKREDLSLLRDKVVIGMNANPLLEEKFGFVSKYYVVSDARFINHPQKRMMATEMLSPETIRVFRYELKNYDVADLINTTYYVKAIGRNGFSFNLMKGYYFGCTTSMLAIQLAVYLGAKNIYILGMDLKYSGSEPRFYQETEVQEYDSFTSTQIMNVRNAFLLLKDKGINLFNCSYNSLLYPYLPYVEFNQTL
ncbi:MULTISPECIES: 6-hydroxymethylpterin diphosphokinase MptE-like protein [unclassified Francisella]|uniref:6-hydroxymethylpterin diphosphokinase MptE-like protein n=1 Tax=unclassified Francisella TaxID=2610885 RepID=UPI002E331082|nr:MULTISPECIES: 6-hydroxymethylpterin diphosphokinase MptE-like protein [unclassified Francisella]MED7820126.1 6-hydroxymethylpterin diphosphokinase MptE-like protein [Francisella sp. 19S2-4]MED7830943.1 6-hydroxymethylpterin diphosphokinase MptE-like protein [Francisella sp. 19S2-10]